MDTVYQRVLATANKEQRGYITPQEFNLLANQAQMEIFESYFYDLNQRNKLDVAEHPVVDESSVKELIGKKLATHTSVANVDSGTTFPTNYQTGRIFYNGYECQEMDINELKNLLNSSRHNARLNKNPLFVKSQTNGEDIEVYAGTDGAQVTSGVTCEIVTKPAEVKWTYTVVNEQALYNASASDLSNFDLHESEETDLVMKILELAGIVINKPPLSQLIGGMQTGELQLEKQ